MFNKEAISQDEWQLCNKLRKRYTR